MKEKLEVGWTYVILKFVKFGFHVLQVMVPFKYTEFIDDLTYLVKNNIIPMDRIDDAVSRILLVKFSMDLFENPLADLSLVDELGSQVSYQTTWTITISSLQISD